MMKDTIENHWLEAETALGFRTFYPLEIRTMKKVTVLYGPSSSALMEISKRYTEKGIHQVHWHALYNPEALTGIAIPKENVCYITSEIARSLVIPSSIHVDSATVGPEVPMDPQIEEIRHRIRGNLQAALTAFNEYCRLVCSPQPIEPDFVSQWAERFLSDGQQPTLGHDLHFFGTPLTALGPHSVFIEERFRRLEDTIHLMGGNRVLNGQLLRRFGEVALMRGFHVHFYHDSLWPSNIDHLIIPDLKMGLTQATPPHELPGGIRETTVNTAPSSRSNREGLSHDIESWWTTYQKFYTNAWRLMEHISHLAEPPRSAPALIIHRYPA